MPRELGPLPSRYNFWNTGAARSITCHLVGIPFSDVRKQPSATPGPFRSRPKDSPPPAPDIRNNQQRYQWMMQNSAYVANSISWLCVG